MACVIRAVGPLSSGSGSGLSPDAYWQLKRAQLESSHSLASHVNTRAVRPVVSPAAPAAAAGTWSRQELLGWTCWHLVLFEVTLPAVVLGTFPELLLEIVTSTAVTSAVIKQPVLLQIDSSH